MTYFSKALFITASGLALCACSGEKKESQSAEDPAVEKVTEAAPVEPAGPNYCYGPEYNPEKPFRFVYFNLKIDKDEMKRIRDDLKAEVEAARHLPQEDQAKAIEPYLAKTQILADLAIQPLADQILPVTATLCNFEIYEKDECRGRLSRPVRKAEVIADTLSYTAPDGRGQTARVFVSSRDFGDVSIDGPRTSKYWSRTADGVESFTFKDPVTETNWTENPDCSGKMTKRRLDISTEVTWTSTNAGALSISYKHCRKDDCHEGRF